MLPVILIWDQLYTSRFLPTFSMIWDSKIWASIFKLELFQLICGKKRIKVYRCLFILWRNSKSLNSFYCFRHSFNCQQWKPSNIPRIYAPNECIVSDFSHITKTLIHITCTFLYTLRHKHFLQKMYIFESLIKYSLIIHPICFTK